MLLYLPGFDLFRLFLDRIFKKRNPFKGDQTHLHHYLNNKIGLRNSIIVYMICLTTPLFLYHFFSINNFICILISIIIYSSIFNYAKISTVCSSYKSGDKINILIKSFNNQEYDFKELIIVEGSETNFNYKLLNKKPTITKIYKIFYLPNSSIYECLNFGIKKSSGDIINIMGDDDKYINENYLKIYQIDFHLQSIMFMEILFMKIEVKKLDIINLIV